MAATELLDYNQIQEQSPSTGDKPDIGGGLLTWNFRCDPNLAWDPSQSWFSMDVKLEQLSASGATSTYVPESGDIRPFFPLRMFSSMTHIIDGVTVAHSNQPYADKLIQERYLKENTQSNLSNFEALQTARMIDSSDPSLNPWLQQGISSVGHEHMTAHNSPVFIKRLTEDTAETDPAAAYDGTADTHAKSLFKLPRATHTIIFQPPFDFWTKHQRCSGGNHQIQMVLKPGNLTTGWGNYVITPCFDQYSRLLQVGLPMGAATYNDTASGIVRDTLQASGQNINSGLTAFQAKWKKATLSADITRIRLLRRMVRFTVERPLSVQEFNLTEMQFYHGTASKTGVTQNFLLPSSTFGLVFYWRDAQNSDYDVVGDFPHVKLDLSATSKIENATDETTKWVAKVKEATLTSNAIYVDRAQSEFFLDQFYFTYGGETYPSQRIQNIAVKAADSGEPYGYEKMQIISHQLQGVYNMPMENMNMTMGVGQSLLTRLDEKSFFFPVAKHNNSDNSDLQVYWSSNSSARDRSLVVVALYDARVELAYNAANQLERVTKTEWK